jgi:hypothetical protein
MWRLLMAEFCEDAGTAEGPLTRDDLASLTSLLLEIAGVGGGVAPAAASSHVPPRPPDPDLFGPRWHA